MSKFKTFTALSAVLVAAAALGTSVISGSQAQFSGKDQDRAALEETIRTYILENPEIIAQALDRYAEQEALFEEARIQENLSGHLPALLGSEDGYIMGAQGDAAKVAVIELFDYHCGYCKSAADYVAKMIETEDDVQFVFRELPILREESEYAAKIALAAREQGRYSDLHFALMDASGLLDEKRIDDIAKKAGLNLGSLHSSRDSAALDEVLERTLEIAIDIGLTGTPSFIVASTDGAYTRIIPYWDAQELEEAIEEARNAS
ncbi:DsbA family protein [Parvularcula sp. IMCC14364]|uniref:DsbA family protein n=1 Tax=Parvularcula sp. IMCC14364 TaxID=3067902 RepID=UPI002740EDAA|nr:DsbA family protein [Parvularcula sp. IMCC14364]